MKCWLHAALAKKVGPCPHQSQLQPGQTLSLQRQQTAVGGLGHRSVHFSKTPYSVFMLLRCIAAKRGLGH